jgi:hypothetical protein
MELLTPEQRQRVRAKLVGTVNCLIPFGVEKSPGDEKNEKNQEYKK